jgi:hypothetical protein
MIMEQGKLFDVPATGVIKSKKKPADVKINRVNRELAGRRYYLHKQLDSNFEVIAQKRKIITGYASFLDIPQGQRYYISQLLQMGYEIQYDLKIFECIEIGGVPVIRGNPPIIKVAHYGLEVGTKVCQVGVPAKSGCVTSSSRVDKWDPWIEYAGLVKIDDDTFMAFLLPPEGVSTNEHFKKDRKPVKGIFYTVYLVFGDGDLLQISQSKKNTYIFRGKFKLLVPEAPVKKKASTRKPKLCEICLGGFDETGPLEKCGLCFMKVCELRQEICPMCNN